MFNIKLEEKSYKMNFKALPVKIQRSKNQQGGGGAMCHPLPGQIGLKSLRIQLLKDALKLFPRCGVYGRGTANDNSGSMIFVSIFCFRERNICLFSSSQSVTIFRTALLIHFRLFAIHLLHALTEGNILICPSSMQDVHNLYSHNSFCSMNLTFD